jgi:thymidylate synthase (FAD)
MKPSPLYFRVTEILNDIGSVELMDWMGDDASTVNAARVSYKKQLSATDDLSEKDIKLIKYLAEHQHFSPFRHMYFQFRVKAPEFVARQW